MSLYFGTASTMYATVGHGPGVTVVYMFCNEYPAIIKCYICHYQGNWNICCYIMTGQ